MMKFISFVMLFVLTIFILIFMVVDRKEAAAYISDPSPDTTNVLGSKSNDAERVVELYIKASQDNDQEALLGYIADLTRLPRHPASANQESTSDVRLEGDNVGRRLDVIDEVGHDFLAKDEPVYIRNLHLVVDRMESRCSPPNNCQVRVFFKKFENREIVHDFIAYGTDGGRFQIVSVLPASMW